MTEIVKTYLCRKCGVQKLDSEFPDKFHRPLRPNCYCITCTAKRKTEHRENNRQSYRDINTAWYRAHPGSKKTWNQAYRAANIEHIRKKERDWRNANIDKARERNRKYHHNRPWEQRRVSDCRKRAKSKGIPFGMKPSDLYDQSGKLPEFCPIFPNLRLDYNHGSDRRLWASVDKKVPILGYVTGNVWVVSMAANTWKSNGSNPKERQRIAALMFGKVKKNKDLDQPSLFSLSNSAL